MYYNTMDLDSSLTVPIINFPDNNLSTENMSKQERPTQIEDSKKSVNSIKKKKSKPSRCHHDGCNKKLSLVDISMGKCKCNRIFCPIHRDNIVHNCSYDWHKDCKSRLASQLMADKCVAQKTEKI